VIESSNNERCNIFNDDEARSKLANDARHFEPKAASITVEASALARRADILAGKPSADEVDSFEALGSDCFDLFMAFYLRPMFAQDASTKRVGFDLPHRATEPGPFEAKL